MDAEPAAVAVIEAEGVRKALRDALTALAADL